MSEPGTEPRPSDVLHSVPATVKPRTCVTSVTENATSPFLAARKLLIKVKHYLLASN